MGPCLLVSMVRLFLTCAKGLLELNPEVPVSLLLLVSAEPRREDLELADGNMS